MRVPWDDKERVTCPNCHGDGHNHGHSEDVPEVMACQRCNANGWIYASDLDARDAAKGER